MAAMVLVNGYKFNPGAAAAYLGQRDAQKKANRRNMLSKAANFSVIGLSTKAAMAIGKGRRKPVVHDNLPGLKHLVAAARGSFSTPMNPNYAAEVNANIAGMSPEQKAMMDKYNIPHDVLVRGGVLDLEARAASAAGDKARAQALNEEYKALLRKYIPV